MSLLVQIAAEFTGKKALKDADKGIQNLTKSTKKLAGALGVALSTTALVNFGKASVKAFVEAEKANTRLAGVVKNLGLSFAQAEIQKNLDEISRAAGIAGEVLVEAYQPLLTATGSVIQSQKMLQQALDISAGSGVELATVTQDLAAAYVGNTKGLRKYNLGVSKAELSTISFAKASALLNKQFSGSQAAYLETYAGKMQVLGEAAGNAQEVIGGALVNALQDVFGAADITELIGKIDILAAKTSNMIDNLAWKWKKFWFATSDKAILSMINPFSNYVKNGLDKIDAEHAAANWRKAMEKSAGFGPDFRSAAGVNQAKMDKAEKDAAKRAKALVDAQKKNTAELKKQALAKKQSALFDMDQIQIIAALKGKISDEERLRLELQLALITGNETEAAKLSRELANTIDQTGNLAKYLTTLPDANNPFKSWEAFLDAMIAKAREAATAINTPITIPQPANLPQTEYNSGTYVPSSGYVPEGNVTTLPAPSNLPQTQYNQGTYVPSSGYVPPAVVVQIDGREIARSLQDQSMSAGQVAYLDRRTGGF